MSLIAERPISFVMDLYSPVYNQRPRVQPTTGVSVAPPSYDRGIAQAPTMSAPSAARSMAPEYAMEEALAGALADELIAANLARRERNFQSCEIANLNTKSRHRFAS